MKSYLSIVFAGITLFLLYQAYEYGVEYYEEQQAAEIINADVERNKTIRIEKLRNRNTSLFEDIREYNSTKSVKRRDYIKKFNDRSDVKIDIETKEDLRDEIEVNNKEMSKLIALPYGHI